MTKKTKRLSIIILFVTAMLAVTMFFIPQINALAEYDHGRPLTNEAFEFERGGTLGYAGFDTPGKHEISFKLNSPYASHWDLMNYSKKYGGGGWLVGPLSELRPDSFTYTFKVNRVNEDGSYTAIAQIVFLYDYYIKDGTGWLRETVVRETLYHTQDVIEISLNDSEYKYGIKWTGEYDEEGNQVFTTCGTSGNITIPKLTSGQELLCCGLKKSGGLANKDSHSMRITIKPPSVYTSYFVSLDSTYYYISHWDLFIRATTETFETIATDARSIYGILTTMDSYGMLEEGEDQAFSTAEGLALAKEYLNKNEKNFTIYWLEEIEGTPFATKKSATVRMKELTAEDALSQLGMTTFNVHDSNFYNFKEVAGEYHAHYLKNIWLRAITEEGSYADYFLDLNLSYRDCFYSFVENGVFDDGLYEWYFSQMISKYPQLSGYTYGQVYGYFGMLVLPKANSIDSMITTLFDVETSSSGMVESFSFERLLDLRQYNTLLTTYQYSWMERAWNVFYESLTGGAEAKYYMFYSLPGTKLGHVGEGGQSGPTDTSGVAQKGLSNLAETIKDIADGVTSTVVSVFGNLSAGLKKLFSSDFSGLLWLVALGFVGVWAFRKFILKK